MLGSFKLSPFIPMANISLLLLSKVMLLGLGFSKFYTSEDENISVLLTVATALLAKRMVKIVTIRREVTPPDTVL